jgi:drug/metabolite transporter (DMT)-like permease
MGVLTVSLGIFSGTPLRAVTDLPHWISFGALGGAFLGIPTALIAGPPVYLLMKRDRMARASHFAFFGGMTALLPCLLVCGPMVLSSPAAAGPIVALFALAGAIGGLVFWFIRRPDRDIAPAAPRPSTGSG